jgi:hypothetical protein
VPVDLKILEIDAQLVTLRREIESSPDKESDDVITKQRQLDKLVEARYARLTELQKAIETDQRSSSAPSRS